MDLPRIYLQNFNWKVRKCKIRKLLANFHYLNEKQTVKKNKTRQRYPIIIFFNTSVSDVELSNFCGNSWVFLMMKILKISAYICFVILRFWKNFHFVNILIIVHSSVEVCFTWMFLLFWNFDWVIFRESLLWMKFFFVSIWNFLALTFFDDESKLMISWLMKYQRWNFPKSFKNLIICNAITVNNREISERVMKKKNFHL